MNTRNYQQEMERAMAAVPKGTPLLLHACCGPCASAVLEVLAGHFAVTVLFYNPNIATEAENEKRLATLGALLDAAWPQNQVGLLEGPYCPEAFYAACGNMGHLPEGGARCEVCFALRMDEAALQAQALGIPWFCTTLTVSPHKNAHSVNAAGEAAAQKYGLQFLPADFKKKDGYRRSTELSRQYGLYRQSYCGCEYSRGAEEQE
ncbi:epoxyqueuosine reductase QueH [Ruminococcaceae bacterium OttesenSCG-928-O06]|nr:epoxyqueuosine reductase QueH [Ruminococcaceae bacterium OttesenSCG-928-O06]